MIFGILSFTRGVLEFIDMVSADKIIDSGDTNAEAQLLPSVCSLSFWKAVKVQIAQTMKGFFRVVGFASPLQGLL